MPLASISQFPFGGALTAANLNAPVNSLKVLVDAFVDAAPTAYQLAANMTVAATANKGVLRGASGEGAFAALTATSVAVSGAINAVTVAATGNIGTGGVFIAGSGSRPITTADGHLDATQLTNSVLISSIIADHKPATSASAGQITVGAGGAYVDSSGNVIGPLTAQAAPLSNALSGTQPTGTNAQYVAISLAAGSGAPVATGGTVGASPALPLVPTANKPIALVLWRGATTNPSNVIAAADITDIRNLGGAGGGAGGGGTDAGVRAAQVWLQGTNGIFSAALDSTNSASVGRIHTNLLRDLSTDAALYDALLNYIQPDFLSRTIVTSGGTIMQVLASADGTSPGPVTIIAGGKKRKIVATVGTVPQAGASGPRYLIADAGSPGTGPTWTLVNPMPGPALPALSANQILIAQLWYDNASGLLRPNTSIDYSNVASLTSGNLKLETVTNQGTANASVITGNSAFQAIPNVPTTTFYLPKAATCFLWCQAAWVASATQTNSQVGAFIDSTYYGQPSVFIPGYATPTGNDQKAVGGIVQLGAGAHTMTQQAYVTTGNSLTLLAQFCVMTLIVFQ